jgi:hypothetical protein
VLRLDAAFFLWISLVASASTERKKESGVKPPHSKVPPTAFSFFASVDRRFPAS